jgi:hypothetical protein
LKGSEPLKRRRIPDCCFAGNDAVACTSVSGGGKGELRSTLPNSVVEGESADDMDGRLSKPGKEEIRSIGCLNSPIVSFSSTLVLERVISFILGIGSCSSFFDPRLDLDIDARRPFKLIELDRALGFLSSVSGDLGAPIGGDLRIVTSSGERE